MAEPAAAGRPGHEQPRFGIAALGLLVAATVAWWALALWPGLATNW